MCFKVLFPRWGTTYPLSITFGPCLTRLIRSSSTLPLINVAEDLATDIFLASLLIGHDSFRSRKNSYAESVQYAGHFGNRSVFAQTRTAYSFKILDSTYLGLGVVLQSDLDCCMALFVGIELVGQDVALFIENLGDLLLNFLTWCFNHLMVGFHRVSNPR